MVNSVFSTKIGSKKLIQVRVFEDCKLKVVEAHFMALYIIALLCLFAFCSYVDSDRIFGCIEDYTH